MGNTNTNDGPVCVYTNTLIGLEDNEYNFKETILDVRLKNI